jgi:D-tyrosyl-tRNA(Tyr) deacylase
MRAVVQRVSRAEVVTGEECLGSIAHGLMVLVAVEEEDLVEDATYLARKTLNLRIFEDAGGKMNLSVQDVGGDLLVVSQFTLCGDCRKGNRPSFASAAAPEKAQDLYIRFLRALESSGLRIASGRFQALMDVTLVNQGPVTILLDSKKRF